MHDSAYEHMKKSVESHLDAMKHSRIVDIGSCMVGGQKKSHRSIVENYNHTYTGVDVVEGENVDIVLKEPYRLPLQSNIADAILCGQVFEHVPFFWVSFIEMARLLKVGGYLFMTVPSRGHVHNGNGTMDAWRFYPDSMRSLAAFSGLELVSVHTDLPPRFPKSRNYDYTKVTDYTYWGDTVAVFKRTQKRSAFNKISTEILVRWANRQAANLPEMIEFRDNRIAGSKIRNA